MTPEFDSFFWGGFECTYAKDRRGRRMDILAMGGHDELCREDYRLLKNLGIKTVREGLAWSSIDSYGGKSYDFSRFEKMMRVAKEEGIQQVWDLNHFDFPDDVDPFSPKFVQRFARYAARAIKIIKKYQKDQIYIVPMNEISFFTFIGATIAMWAPYAKGRDAEFKQQLVRAAIAAMDAIWEVDDKVRFIQVDPIFRRIPLPPITPGKKKIAENFIVEKFEAFDMLSGRAYPELGGHPRYLDIIGANYYIYCQEWIVGEKKVSRKSFRRIPLGHPDRVTVGYLFKELFDRYNRPIVMTETGSWGTGRPKWWKNILKESDEALAQGLPLAGICAYPIIDRHDWSKDHLTNSGLWDFADDDPTFERIPHEKTIKIIREYIDKHKIIQKQKPPLGKNKDSL